jgi:Phage integrase family
MAFAVDGASAPTIVNSSGARTREYLTGPEVEKLMEAARKSSRYGRRDATMILIAYRHGLRASEVCDLKWQSGRAQCRAPACAQEQARNAERSSDPGRRTSGAATPAARAAARAVRLHVRACWSDRAEELSHDDIAPRPARRHGLPNPSPHAAPWLRLRAGERRT